jgi:predicted ATP-dependent endonuclease of OLD family
LDIDSEDYDFFCEQWFFEPLKSMLISEDIEHREVIQEIFPTSQNISEFFNLGVWKALMAENFSKNQCIFRMEFIRYSDIEQEINYSMQFNDFIMVNTADGRQFLEKISGQKGNKNRETEFWDINLFQCFMKILNPAINSLKNQKLESNMNGNNIILLKKEIKQQYIQILKNSTGKFIFSSKSVDIFIKKFLNQIFMVKGNRVMEEKDQNLSRDVSNKLFSLQEKAISTINKNEKSGLNPYWDKYIELQKRFEEIYDSLDLTFGFIRSTESNRLELRYFQRSNNTVMQNFDSIGTGITEMLEFLYMIIVETDNILFIQDPERNLHPHSQRTIYNLLKQYSMQNQLMVITHSLFLFQPEDLFQLRVFILKNGITSVNQLQPPSNQKDIIRLRRNFSIRNRDAIFADGLIFVEGPSEEWSFGYFFNAFGLDLDLNNLSLINIGGKSSFSVFKNFARQLKKNYWFFFDNDVLGHKAGQMITPKIFKSSVIFKNRNQFSPKIVKLCNSMIDEKGLSTIEFEEKLEGLRNLLENFHIFVFPTDFEGVFEDYLENRVKFSGSKVVKAMQLVEFLKDHENEQLLPDKLYYYIDLIRQELR